MIKYILLISLLSITSTLSSPQMIANSLLSSLSSSCSLNNLDFSLLQHTVKPDYMYNDANYTWFINICNNTISSCKDDPDNKAAAFWSFGESKYACNNLGTISEMQFELNQNNNVVLTYNNGDICNLNTNDTNVVTFSMSIEFQCDQDITGQLVSVTGAVVSCNHYGIFKTKYACTNTPPPSPPSSPSSGSIGGWIFFGLFFGFIFFYIGIGLVYNYGQGKTGYEMFPNYEFWVNFPNLVSDGCLYSKYLTLTLFSYCGACSKPEFPVLSSDENNLQNPYPVSKHNNGYGTI